MVKLYVEGGGDSAALRTACREGFTKFITKAGLQKRPRIVACGSRQNAYDSYCTAIARDEAAMLLVDSEAPVAAAHQTGTQEQWQPWDHLKARKGDGWDKPTGANDSDCHMMVQIMEYWFVADRQTLKNFFGHDLSENALPSTANPIERLEKADVFESLKTGTRNCLTKGQYDKGDHSFKLLADLNPAVVMAASPWAKRFVDLLGQKMNQ